MSQAPTQPSKSEQFRAALLIATGIVVIAWFVPGLAVLTVPINYLGTQTHELSHALAALATGAQGIVVHVYADGSGLTNTRGGNPILISSAGYLGATIAGAALIAGSSSEKRAKRAVGILAGILAVGSLLWLRGDGIGLVTALGWLAALVALAKWGRGLWVILAAQFLGLQLCVASAQSLMTLLNVTALATRESDAQNMANLTGVPGLVWALTWCALATLAVLAALRRAWR